MIEHPLHKKPPTGHLSFTTGHSQLSKAARYQEFLSSVDSSYEFVSPERILVCNLQAHEMSDQTETQRRIKHAELYPAIAHTLIRLELEKSPEQMHQDPPPSAGFQHITNVCCLQKA